MPTKHKYAILLILAIFIGLVLVAYLHKLFKKPPSFHILIATGGRPALRNLLDSLKHELTEHDAITVVFDGDKAKAKSTITPEWLEGHKSTIHIIEQTPNLGYWGHGIRNKYQGDLRTKTTYVLNADDDDIYLPGSFDNLRRECVDPEVLYIAKMDFSNDPNYIVPGQNEKILHQDIGTPNGIIPFKSAGMAEWALRHGGDFEYYNALQHKLKAVKFLQHIIYRVN